VVLTQLPRDPGKSSWCPSACHHSEGGPSERGEACRAAVAVFRQWLTSQRSTSLVRFSESELPGRLATEADRSPDEGPQHEVTIAKPFAVGRTEVTFAQWDSCVAAGACRKLGDNAWGRGDRPVINVGWSEAAYHQLAQRYPLRRAVWLSPEFHWAPWRLAMQGSARW
jgi:formylglycine-generating enzyme required for sulfatase activity